MKLSTIAAGVAVLVAAGAAAFYFTNTEADGVVDVSDDVVDNAKEVHGERVD